VTYVPNGRLAHPGMNGGRQSLGGKRVPLFQGQLVVQIGAYLQLVAPIDSA